MFSHDPYAELATLRDFAPMTITSEDVDAGAPLPKAHWGADMGGSDTSPQLSWTGAPEGTKSFALSIYDPDAPTGSGFWHWAVYDLPASTTSLPRGAGSGAGLPSGAVTLPNEMRSTDFIGAAPPAGTGVHRYFIVVTALDVDHLEIPEGATPAILGFNAHFHALARGILVATATSD